jgi:hypothetical protein
MFTVEKIADCSVKICDLSDRGFSRVTSIKSFDLSTFLGLYPRIVINRMIMSTMKLKTAEVYSFELEDCLVSFSSLSSSGEEQ